MTLKIAMITPWAVKCGIFSYTRDLSLALAQEDVDIYISRLPRFGEKTVEILQNVVDKIPKDVDIICCQHEYGLYQLLEKPFYAMLKQLGKPIITTIHAPGFKNDGVISEGSDRVIVHNEYCARRFNYPSVIIPHGTSIVKCPKKEDCKKAYGIDPKIPVVGYLGFIAEMKGLETLISAMSKVPNAALLMCGGWHLGEGTAYMWDLKEKTLQVLQGRCHWAGFIPDEQVPVAYGSMDILAYPSVAASESGGLLLGLSHGKATISSDVPPFREKEAQGALMTFKTQNSDDLADKIKLLLSDTEQREKLEKGAVEFCESISWSKVAQKHIDLYNEVLAEAKQTVNTPVSPT